MPLPLTSLGPSAEQVHAIARVVSAIGPPLELAALGPAVVLAAFGLHRIELLRAYFRGAPRPTVAGPPAAQWPAVLVQLPIFNEGPVVVALLDAIAALRWPSGRLTVQILDDSTDETPATVTRWLGEHATVAQRFRHVRRSSRSGFKAGALRHGLSLDQAPFVAIFDADFRPTPDFLERAVPPLLVDPGLAFTQGRWTHLNRSENGLSDGAATLLDGHFVLEHGGRARAGRWFNFNGTAGVWRRAAIDDAGGWSGATLCEDLDLSYRAQMRGWRAAFLEDLEVPAEVPAAPSAFLTQQFRWAKGALQNARLHLGAVVRSPAPLHVRIEAATHLLSPASAPLVTLWLVLWPAVLAVREGEVGGPVLVIEAVATLGAAVVVLFYAVAAARAERTSAHRVARSVFRAVPLGVALCVNGTIAAWEALREVESPFVRTPKGVRMRTASGRAGWQPALERALALWILLGAGAAALRDHPGSALLLLWFTTGFRHLGRSGVAAPLPQGEDDGGALSGARTA